jgi:hypothetical protein
MIHLRSIEHGKSILGKWPLVDETTSNITEHFTLSCTGEATLCWVCEISSWSWSNSMACCAELLVLEVDGVMLAVLFRLMVFGAFDPGGSAGGQVGGGMTCGCKMNFGWQILGPHRNSVCSHTASQTWVWRQTMLIRLDCHVWACLSHVFAEEWA